MKKILALGALTSGVVALTNGCADNSNVFDASGNAYCEPAVSTIKYTGVGGSGTYKTVSNIDASNVCTWTSGSYSGPLGPYADEIGIIMRGPLKLRQFAVYSADSSASKLKKRTEDLKKEKRAVRPSPHERRHAHAHGHGHQHFHQHNKEVRAAHEKADAEKRAVGDWVTATIDGQVVSWVNTYAGTPAANAANAVADSDGINIVVAADDSTSSPAAPTTAAPTSTAPASSASSAKSTASSSVGTSDANGSWKRISYYNSEEKTYEGVTFLTHPPWRNVLAFAGVESTTPASESTCFGGELDNANELVLMTDAPCSEDIGTECAYFKEGDEAFHGYGGAKKAFFFEFTAPDSGLHCSVQEMASKYVADNMPAIWSLNAKILTSQYGCNCQESGCGELDFLEVLNPGNKRMKSTFHGQAGFSGGDSHYIERPFDRYMSVVAVMDEDTFVLKVLPDNTEAPASLTQELVDQWTGANNDTLENVLGELAVFALSPV